MTLPRRRLRTRLLVATVVIAFGTLLVATLGAAVLARRTAADSSLRSLRSRAPDVATTVDALGQQVRAARTTVRNVRLEATLTKLLDISGASVFGIRDDGTIEQGLAGLLGTTTTSGDRSLLDLPSDLRVRDLDVVALLAGRTESGQRGNTVYVATPLQPVDSVTPVVVLSDGIERNALGRAGPFLFVTGALALAAAAWLSFLLARRVTTPLSDIERAAERIAAGDLSVRVATDALRDHELSAVAQSFNAMAGDLETARGLERAFLLSVSHDLRTPLTSIKGYAEAITDGAIRGDDDTVAAARIIGSESRRLERLVRDLLDLVRLDAHQFALAPRAIDAREVLESSVDAFHPTAREWDVTISVEPGPACPLIADPERLGQIVANLVENALKFAAASVRVGLTSTDTTVEIHVDDDGPGVPESEREQVFERLHTARGTPGRSVGTGIGLAIVRELALAMGGTASCEPLEHGTRFRVTIAR